ncbi:hypothetical protein DDB_G0293466 [Dictyostelium discoideum AX4]|uniref:hypothetical protein n=1 Tax=Dictyostelium discoideum AX4 TaxID=352472 RepID=UPI00004E2F25|nr:hypothetical protein DDB_G0293466 [Dictyostelium discoideum AX4]EAL60717.1 hypothetical protein DDB_G0293466 [Dictyostelium discoideum AX4]|eukprot:XP_629127.1 hypothetical protein DDB_G0293466 [Dictyostelium discoideum AX4]
MQTNPSGLFTRGGAIFAAILFNAFLSEGNFLLVCVEFHKNNIPILCIDQVLFIFHSFQLIFH